MWTPTSFERKRATNQQENGPDSGGTELLADGVQISSAVERVRWDEDPIHLAAHTDCLAGDCVDGAWLSIRRAGSHLLFLPSFSRWLVEDWYDTGYEDAPAFLKKGAMLLDRAHYADLRALVPELPVVADLQPLAGWEAVRLLRFEAPVEVLGKASEPVRLRRGLVLQADWWGTNELTIAKLEQLLETWSDSYDPVALKHLPLNHVPVTFSLADGSRSVEWQPLSAGLRDLLLLEPGYVVDRMPELPQGIHTDTLMVTTRPRERLSLQTEISVNNHPLYDFTGHCLGVDLCELGRSLRWDGEYFIITCSCGNAGCAGIWRGVDVYRDDRKVYWVISEPEPARTFVFDEHAYHEAVDAALAEFRDLCAQHPTSLLDRHKLGSLARIDEPPRMI